MAVFMSGTRAAGPRLWMSIISCSQCQLVSAVLCYMRRGLFALTRGRERNVGVCGFPGVAVGVHVRGRPVDRRRVLATDQASAARYVVKVALLPKKNLVLLVNQ